MKGEDGYLRIVQFGRVDLPAEIQRKLDIYRGWPKTYTEGRKKFLSIPKEKRRIPYFTHGNVIILVPENANHTETIKNAEALVEILKIKWKEELEKST